MLGISLYSCVVLRTLMFAENGRMNSICPVCLVIAPDHAWCC